MARRDPGRLPSERKARRILSPSLADGWRKKREGRAGEEARRTSPGRASKGKRKGKGAAGDGIVGGESEQESERVGAVQGAMGVGG